MLVDEIYEFENNRYRTASIQMKAIAYDIVIESKNKKPEEKRNAIVDEIINLTEKIEKQLEQLDSLEEEKEIKEEKIEEKTSPQPPEEKPKEEPIPEKSVEEKKDVIQKIEASQEEKQPEEKEPTPPGEKPVETTPIVANQPTSAKKQFKKTIKNLSKAIMVKQNQLENLRNSRTRQEQLVATKGVFDQVEKDSSNVIEQNPVVKKPLPDNVEREIEDLTVKANIYYNEGEIEKAQELYDRIKELNQAN